MLHNVKLSHTVTVSNRPLRIVINVFCGIPFLVKPGKGNVLLQENIEDKI